MTWLASYPVEQRAETHAFDTEQEAMTFADEKTRASGKVVVVWEMGDVA